ncbi:bis-tetraphosphatase [Lepidopterella palustris CBS 459.81]|uniref:Bis-tetraphosphatase n=1 Tax=Lepidopterella palustris CBS 459.81 TaxID=1314670 RepID=A0A8E2EBV0_9PEZI|nr:bis-tetraphosphatase [Lepidopterella palustris CBS 459.81]
MLLGLSESLPSLVHAKFNSAKAAQNLIFSLSELAIIPTTFAIPFQLRYCPSLAKKPKVQKDEAPRTTNLDPFDNPPSHLLIANIPAINPTHLLVLNKFPIIPEHFILATKIHKQQTHLLEQEDLEATYACLKAWESGEAHGRRRRLFAFFNSGGNSGASQPHRHLQFLPVDSMQEGSSRGWEMLIDVISATPPSPQNGLQQLSRLPLVHFAFPLPQDPSPTQLLQIYQALYKAAVTSVYNYIESHPNDLELHSTDDGSLPISYNLAMTTSTMVICPRRREGGILGRDDGSEIGSVALNGTVLAGMLMVKHEEEWDTLRAQPEKLDKILEAIGIPLSQGQAGGDSNNKL